MIALDTNVVVRFLVGDDIKQARRVRQLLEAASADREPCFLGDAVLCEVEWVLESAYDAQRGDIIAAIQRLLSHELFVFEEAEIVRRALDLYQAGRADFSDYLIGLRGQAKGARTTYTFDHGLRGAPEFTVL